jgi:hypothetical protein
MSLEIVMAQLNDLNERARRSVTAFAELFSLDCLCRLSHAEFC